MLFKERIQKYEYKLNDTDDQIIEYILENTAEVTGMSIQSLAKRMYTVPNTIMRLSKKLGYDGFSHLKSSLKDEMTQGKTAVENTSYHYIQKTFELLDEEILMVTAKLIKDAKYVLFFGAGDNADFCNMMVKNLRVVGKTAYFFIHRHENLHLIKEMGERDVLFLISLSGKTSQVLEMAEEAKKRNVQIITLTHFNRNPLQKLADYKLYCYAPYQELNGYNITDHTPVMIVLQALSQKFWKLYSFRA